MVREKKNKNRGWAALRSQMQSFFFTPIIIYECFLKLSLLKNSDFCSVKNSCSSSYHALRSEQHPEFRLDENSAIQKAVIRKFDGFLWIAKIC